jgi:hypothetical protein
MEYEYLINKMPRQKIREVYYNCNLVSNVTPLWCNVHIIHMDVINLV